MKNWYKAIGMGAMLIASAQTFAQTQYGVGAGTVGIGRAFFGTDAGKINGAAKNTFIGQEAGRLNVVGVGNTYVGHRAGFEGTGHLNTFVGSGAGEKSSQHDNTFVGVSAGSQNNGSYCTIVGTLAGAGSNGNFNTFFGHSAGYKTTGESNVFLGEQAGYKNSTGAQNVFSGRGAGHENEGGMKNVFTGDLTGFNNMSGNQNAFVGTESGYSNKIGNYNSFFGTNSGYKNTSGNNNVFIGYGAGYDNDNGSKNTFLGYAAGGKSNVVNSTAIGAMALVTASNSIVLGNAANVGIGVNAPAFQLHLSSDAAAKAGSPAWTVASDARLKKDVSDYTDGLDMLKQIKPVWFSYNGQAGIQTGDKKFVGIIAQDMQKIAPYMVGRFTYQDSLGNKTEYLDYDANAVTYMLINSVKEQQQVIEEKDAKIKEVTGQVAELSKRLEAIERLVANGRPLTGNPAAKLGAEPNANGVILEQNAPNGFSENTVIKFFVPQNVKEAVINVYSVSGVKVASYPVKERGASEIKLSASQLAAGTLVYDLVTDGISNGAKKMVVNK